VAGGSRRRRRPARLVTLASDLGSAYAAQMKAVLHGAVADARLVDLTHDLRPHAVAEAAFVLRPTLERWPAGAVHVVVVDPGVGGRRQPVAVACRDGSVFVGPDNGVLGPLVDAHGGGLAYRIDPARLRARPRVGTTFDGRDIFAPAAALLATGLPPHRLGPPTDLARPRFRLPRRGSRGADGSIAHIDRFGNVVTDVPTDWLPEEVPDLAVRLGRTWRRLPRRRSYEDAGPGRLFVLGSSFGTLELAVAGGRAADRLRTRLGARVRFAWGARRGLPARRNRK
jgi:S-adenosyl-L-methionine hydrolase (adenosine-forming)